MNPEDNVALAMLAMAETLRLQQPPKYKMAIKCARGALTLTLSQPISAHVQLQLGKLLLYYTENIEQARTILETSYQLNSSMGDYFLAPRLEALSLLCEAYLSGNPTPSNLNRILVLVRTDLNLIKQFPSIFVKLCFYFIEATTLLGNDIVALETCDTAIQVVQHDPVNELYFHITKYLVKARLDLLELDEESGTIRLDAQAERAIAERMARLDPNSPVTIQLRLYLVCTKLSYMLSHGMTRSARQFLREMQQDVPLLSKDSHALPGFRWMEQMPLTVFACLMTVVTSTLQCNFERAIKYFTIAMRHINEFNIKSAATVCEYGVFRSMQRMRLSLNEMVAQCYIMACKPFQAMDHIRDMVVISDRMGADVVEEFGPNIQSLLGLYSVYLNEMGLAEKHFQSALAFKSCQEKDRWVMTNVNLGMVYLSQCKHAEYYGVADRLVAHIVNNCSLLVKSNVLFLRAVHLFLLHKQSEAKNIAADCMGVSKKEDLFRLHGLAILLFSTMTLVDLPIIQPTMDWSKKGLDHALHQWSNESIGRLLTEKGHDATICKQAVEREKALLNPQTLAIEHQKHPAAALIQWFEGDGTSYLPSKDD